MLVLFLLVMLGFKGVDFGSTVIVNIPKGAVESRALTTTQVNANSDTVNREPIVITSLAATQTTANTIPASDISDTKKLRNVSLIPSHPTDNKRFSNDHQLPHTNQTGLNISDYINILVNLFHLKPDDDFDSVTVIQKQLNLTHCLVYQIENEKLMHSLLDLYKVYLALHTIWFPSTFERYLTATIEGITHWNHKNQLTFYNHIKNALANATMELLVMKTILGVTNVTLMNMIHKGFKVTDKVLFEQLMASSKIKELAVSIQQTIDSQRPAHHEGSDFHSKLIYYPALERYLSSLIITMNARDVCSRVCASL